MKLKLHFFATAITALILSGCGAPSTAPDPVVDASEAERVRDAGPTAPLSTDPETVSDTRKIVMLGDSLTAGFGLPPSDALPDQLERLLIAQDYAVEFVNAGVSGDTSAGGLARYDWSVASVNPDILVVALGANDYLSGLDPDQTRANLTAIIERAQAADIPILLVSLSARSSEASDPRAAAFDVALVKLRPGLVLGRAGHGDLAHLVHRVVAGDDGAAHGLDLVGAFDDAGLFGDLLAVNNLKPLRFQRAQPVHHDLVHGEAKLSWTTRYIAIPDRVSGWIWERSMLLDLIKSRLAVFEHKRAIAERSLLLEGHLFCLCSRCHRRPHPNLMRCFYLGLF